MTTNVTMLLAKRNHSVWQKPIFTKEMWLKTVRAFSAIPKKISVELIGSARNPHLAHKQRDKKLPQRPQSTFV
jgi:hypothetical protein